MDKVVAKYIFLNGEMKKILSKTKKVMDLGIMVESVAQEQLRNALKNNSLQYRVQLF
jgi:hypothetical protein